MPSVKLTSKFVEHAPTPKAGRVEFWDATLPAFGLRVTEKGAKSWVVMYRNHGRLRRLTLGPYPALSLAKAREAAGEALRNAAKGEDPAAEKRRAKREAADADTLKAVGALFVERYAKRYQARSWRETERILQVNVYPEIGHMPMTDVRRSHVLELLDKVGDRRERAPARGKKKIQRGGPMAARNTHKALRKLFRWAHEDRGIIEANPIAGLKSPAPDTKRERVLSDDEIRALWKLWDEPSPYNAACKVMLLTGQRVHEVSKMRRREIDVDGNWVIPVERYKTKLAHMVPLTKAAKAIIDAQPAIEGSDLVFTLSGAELNGWSNAKERMDRESGVKDWQLRDLRRTARTLMTRHGVDFFIAERVIGHVIGGVAGVYDRYSYLEEKRRALETLAGAIDRILNPPGANVVPLRSAPSG